MSEVVISVEYVSKQYRLGAITHRTFQRDLQAWWARLRGREDPNLPVEGGRHRKLKALADENGIIHALKDVSFEVRQGEVLGIIGKNGAGKSTLLKILSQVTAPTTGCIRIRGRVGSLLEVGTGFHPELTGRENIYMNGAILGMKKREIDRKLDEIIDFSGVEQFIDTPVKRYSSGMFVRLAFAVAAHLEPEILVVDEVLAVGDAEFQKKCLGKMGDVSKKEGRTVLFVSHNMGAVKSICGRGLHIDSGRILNDGAVETIIADYLSAGGRGAEDGKSSPADLPREKEYEHLIKDVWIENKEGVRNSTVLSGEPMRICCAFSSKEPILNCGVGFGIEDVYGERIFSLNNYMLSGSDRRNALSSGVAECLIDELPLLQGSYSLTVSIMEKGTTILDCLERMIRFDVLSADIYGTGIVPPMGQGKVYVRASMRIRVAGAGKT